MARHLYTSEIAKRAGVHPNTVRLYEEWGFLPPVPRSPSGYRLFTEAHLDQMRLARAALHGSWPGKPIRDSALGLVRRAASGDLDGALALAHRHLALVQAEQVQAEAAVQYLEQWADRRRTPQIAGTATEGADHPLWIGQAAELLHVTPDMLRNWERNGLLRVPRDSRNGYRLYAAAEIGRLRVIRLLNQAGYSQMAILRMILHLDRSGGGDLRKLLDTPRPDEDVVRAADRWISALAEQEQRARGLIACLEAMISKWG